MPPANKTPGQANAPRWGRGFSLAESRERQPEHPPENRRRRIESRCAAAAGCIANRVPETPRSTAEYPTAKDNDTRLRRRKTQRAAPPKRRPCAAFFDRRIRSTFSTPTKLRHTLWTPAARSIHCFACAAVETAMLPADGVEGSAVPACGTGRGRWAASGNSARNARRSSAMSRPTV